MRVEHPNMKQTSFLVGEQKTHDAGTPLDPAKNKGERLRVRIKNTDQSPTSAVSPSPLANGLLESPGIRTDKSLGSEKEEGDKDAKKKG